MAQKLGIEQAIEIALEAELKAQAFYAQAALAVQDPAGRDLLGRLAAFEQYHYDKLSELARSLQRDGKFISYEARNLQHFRSPLPLPQGEGRGEGARGEGPKDVPGILTVAIDKEKTAGERYRVLAQDTDDPDGNDMFKKLATEETIHQRILEDEFFTLSNQGVWGWSGMYGE